MRTILARAEARGCFILDGREYPNRFTRNMGYVIDGLLRRVDVSVFDEGGTSRTASTGSGGLLWSPSADNEVGIPLHIHYGTGVTTPSVTDNNLASPDAAGRLSTHYLDTLETDTETRFLVANRWAPDTARTYSEVGLKWVVNTLSVYTTLLARSLISPPLSRSAYTEVYDGYVIRFPAAFTRWFARALLAASSGIRIYTGRAHLVTATDGSPLVLRSGDTFAGTLDVQIGSDNTPPSPTHHRLLSPIASLSSQTQAVEVDTTLQEVRVVRSGTYTPPTTVELGEVALYATLHGFRAGSAVTAPVMVARVAISPKVTLAAGTTYTIGIVLVFP